MGRVNAWLLAPALLILAACAAQPAVVCNEPYLLVGTACCLDSDGNGVCDSDDGLLAAAGGTVECEELDCSLCPATVIQRNVTITETKYVCERDGSVVVDMADCEGNRLNDPFEDYEPYDGAEDGSVIEEFGLRAACRDSEHAVEIHYVLGSVAQGLKLQVKESPTGSWRDIFTADETQFEDYLYGAICTGYCTPNADFYIAPDAVYMLRAELDYEELYGETQRSNEYKLDLREDGEYLTKLC